jgi:DNA-binding response OmpR family regulator
VNEIVAVVDDEADLRELLRTSLTREGFRVREHSRGGAFLASLSREAPDAVVLDVMLPDIDGMEVCRRLRTEPRGATLPVIMLTARAAEGDRVLGLEIGADDYVTKPFSPKELAARVRAVLRRSGRGAPAGAPAVVGVIAIDREAHTVTVADRRVDLTAAEFRLLDLLASRAGQVFTREQILDGLWGDEKSVTDRSVDVHIRHLREKLGAEGARVVNVRGVGYKLES